MNPEEKIKSQSESKSVEKSKKLKLNARFKLRNKSSGKLPVINEEEIKTKLSLWKKPIIESLELQEEEELNKIIETINYKKPRAPFTLFYKLSQLFFYFNFFILNFIYICIIKKLT